ncbi:hypothetical protein AAVH_22200 [Aphelenchoides avenae]|nr:hypothetical protein AAVH_22200 [Aphelenchus avenae]
MLSGVSWTCLVVAAALLAVVGIALWLRYRHKARRAETRSVRRVVFRTDATAAVDLPGVCGTASVAAAAAQTDIVTATNAIAAPPPAENNAASPPDVVVPVDVVEEIEELPRIAGSRS